MRCLIYVLISHDVLPNLFDYNDSSTREPQQLSTRGPKTIHFLYVIFQSKLHSFQETLLVDNVTNLVNPFKNGLKICHDVINSLIEAKP